MDVSALSQIWINGISFLCVCVTFENPTSTFISSIRQSLNTMQAPAFFAVDILHEPRKKLALLSIEFW